MQKQPIPPFQCQYDPGFVQLLHRLGCSLALSTYQAGKVVLLSAPTPRQLIQLPRTFPKAMGIGLRDHKMVLATEQEVLVLADSPVLAQHFPKRPQTYDAMYMPRVTYYTGPLDVHDIDFCSDRICAVNTSFSCLIEVNSDYSFQPIWQPDFIDHLAAEDRCHLNGMAIKDDVITHVTAFAQSNRPKGWREHLPGGGLLIDVQTNEILFNELAMPHSPRWFEKNLYVLLSATGELARIDIQRKQIERVCQLNGFVRGMAYQQGYVFIGISKFRESSTTFAKLDAARAARFPGVVAVELSSGRIVGELYYHNSVEEIYDVQILPGVQRPNILNTIRPDHRLGLTTPEQTFWGDFKA